MHRQSPVRKRVFAHRSFRVSLLALPVAAFALLAGCGAHSDDNDPYAVPSLPGTIVASPIPVPGVSPAPGVSPLPTASPVAPAQIVSGTLRIEDASGSVVVTPFTPTSGSADVPTGFVGVLNPAVLTFNTSEPFTDAKGTTVSKRTVEIGLPTQTEVSDVVQIANSTPRAYVSYDETLNSSEDGAFSHHYETSSSADAGTLKLVSVENNVYTIAVDALLLGEGGNSAGNFHLRGTISIYVPKPATDPLTPGLPGFPIGGIGYE